MIKYANGRREHITLTQTKAEKKPVQALKPSPDKMYAIGKEDARKLYKGNGAMLGTAGCTLLFPPAGLIEGIISASIAPKINVDKVSDISLLADPN